MNYIELPPMFFEKRERVSLMKLERVARLRFTIHAHNIKPCHVVAHPSAARAAKEIK